MSADEAQAEGREQNVSPELQFDRVDTGLPGDATAAKPGVVCAVCGKSIDTQYYHVNGKPICENCRYVVLSATVTPRTAGPLVRAGIFGLGAAIAGAAIYYAVIAIANLEIGIVAILIGYMVGYSVRKGAGGRGGRRFQILAVALTYWSVGLAYAPLAMKQSSQGRSDKTASTTDSPDTGRIANPVGAKAKTAADDTSGPISGRAAALAFGALFVLVFALPVLSVISSLPMGLISAFIIFIGLRQAWSMTAAPKLDISGPYKVGADPAAATT
jgi:hypothetical protein